MCVEKVTQQRKLFVVKQASILSAYANFDKSNHVAKCKLPYCFAQTLKFDIFVCIHWYKCFYLCFVEDNSLCFLLSLKEGIFLFHFFCGIQFLMFFFSVKEGVFLQSRGISVYSGGVFHETPLTLFFAGFLIRSV